MIYKKFTSWHQYFIAIIIPVFIFLFYFLFNFNYITAWIDEMGDVLTYDYYVRLGIPSFLFNPHHIGFDWIGKVMLDFLKNLGYTDSSMLILQMRNLLVSSAGLGLFFYFFYKISLKPVLSLLITLSIAFSCGYWIYSIINDTPIIHSILVCTLFFILIHFPNAKNKPLYSVLIGLFHAINIFFHQYDLIFILVILFIMVFFKNFLHKNPAAVPVELGSLVSRRPSADSNNSHPLFIKNFQLFDLSGFKYFLIYLTVFLILVGSAYYYVGFVKIGLTLNKEEAKDLNKIKDATYFFNWLILYTRIDHWGKGLSKGNLFSDIQNGVSTYFLQPQTVHGITVESDLNRFLDYKHILPNLLLLMVFLTLLTAVLFFKKLYQYYGVTFPALMLFLIIYFLFSCWWQPEYREFWVATLFPFWILFFLILNFSADKINQCTNVLRYPLYTFLILIPALLFYFNFTGFIYPYSQEKYRKFDLVNSNSIITKERTP